MSKIAKICAVCSSEFIVPPHRSGTAKYCSKRCHGIELRQPGSALATCEVCNAQYWRTRKRSKFLTKTCSKKCRGIATRKATPIAKDVSGLKKWFRRRGLMKQCEDCGYKEMVNILVIHHKDRDRTNNALNNLKVLCPNCHAIEHLAENLNGWSHKSTKRRTDRQRTGNYAS